MKLDRETYSFLFSTSSRTMRFHFLVTVLLLPGLIWAGLVPCMAALIGFMLGCISASHDKVQTSVMKVHQPIAQAEETESESELDCRNRYAVHGFNTTPSRPRGNGCRRGGVKRRLVYPSSSSGAEWVCHETDHVNFTARVCTSRTSIFMSVLLVPRYW